MVSKQPFQYPIKEIQSKHHHLTLDYRGQDRLIQSDLFVEAWNRASEDERKWILKLFSNPDTHGLKKCVLEIVIGGLEQYPTNVLRQLASYHKIRNYSRMSKLQLLTTLTKKGVISDSKNSRGNNK